MTVFYGMPIDLYSDFAISQMGLKLSFDGTTYVRSGKKTEVVTLPYTELFTSAVVNQIQEAARLCDELKRRSSFRVLFDSFFLIKSLHAKSDYLGKIIQSHKFLKEKFDSKYTTDMLASHKTLKLLRSGEVAKQHALTSLKNSIDLSARISLYVSIFMLGIGAYFASQAVLIAACVVGAVAIGRILMNSRVDQAAVENLHKFVGHFIDENGQSKMYTSEFFEKPQLKS